MHRGHRPVNLPSSLRDSKLVPTSLSPSQKLISGEREGFLYCRSVAQLCPTLCDSKDCRMPGFPVLHHLQILFRFMSIESVMPSNHLLLCYPLLLLSVFLSIRIFSNRSVLHIRWPKYWSFSFSISPPNEYSGLISFTIDWFDLLEVQGTLFPLTCSNLKLIIISLSLTPKRSSIIVLRLGTDLSFSVR